MTIYLFREPNGIDTAWHECSRDAYEAHKGRVGFEVMVVPQWEAIETAPKGKPIIVHYTNNYGKGRTVKAYYIEKFTEKSSSDSENDEYNEEDDTYYTLPGWYEMIDNWEDYSAVAIYNEPTHWMPLPDAPITGATHDH